MHILAFRFRRKLKMMSSILYYSKGSRVHWVSDPISALRVGQLEQAILLLHQHFMTYFFGIRTLQNVYFENVFEVWALGVGVFELVVWVLRFDFFDFLYGQFRSVTEPSFSPWPWSGFRTGHPTLTKLAHQMRLLLQTLVCWQFAALNC